MNIGIKPTLKIGLATDVGHPCTFQPNLGEYHVLKIHWSVYRLIQQWSKDTFEVQYFQHIAPIRTSLQLFDLFEIHPKETVPSALVHRKFPYTVGSSSLGIVKRSLVHLKRVKVKNVYQNLEPLLSYIGIIMQGHNRVRKVWKSRGTGSNAQNPSNFSSF